MSIDAYTDPACLCNINEPISNIDHIVVDTYRLKLTSFHYLTIPTEQLDYKMQ